MKPLLAALTIVTSAILFGCSGDDDGGNPVTPPATFDQVVISLQDWAPGLNKEPVLITLRDWNGREVSSSDNQVVFSNVLRGTVFTVLPGGSHVMNAGDDGDEVFAAHMQNITRKFLDNDPEVLRFILNSGVAYAPRSLHGIADSDAFSGRLDAVRAGFDLATRCAHGEADHTVELGKVSADGSVPAGADFIIVDGPSVSWDGTVMALPAESRSLQTRAAAGALRAYGVVGDYGGYEEGNGTCAYAVLYSTLALRNGAPKS